MVELTQQKIISNIQNLSSFQLAEILNFVEYVNFKYRNNYRDYSAIDSICGKYKNDMSSSEKFAEDKKNEIIIEDEKWKRN